MRSPADRSSVDRPIDDYDLPIDPFLGFTDAEAETDTRYRIGELSREFGVTLRSLRFYEDKGLLHPIRNGVTRIYTASDRSRLRLILLAKALGFTLVEAQELISLHNSPGSTRSKIEVTLQRFEEQKGELLAQRQNVEQSINTADLSIRALREQLVAMPA